MMTGTIQGPTFSNNHRFLNDHLVLTGLDLTLRNTVVKNFVTDLFLSDLTLTDEGGKCYSKTFSQTTWQHICYGY